MRELRYERGLREWALARGFRPERYTFPRPGGRRALAWRLSPPRPLGRVVSLHGAGNDALFACVALFRSLLERGLEVFAFDLDGHGRGSDTRLGHRSARETVEAGVAEATRDRPELPLHLVGVSLGGSLLLHALPRLDAASASLLAAPLRIELSPGTAVRELRPALLRTLWREREHYGLTGLVPSFGPFRRGLFPLRLEARAPGAFGYVSVLNSILEDLHAGEAARRVTTPTLLVYGASDRIVPASQGERLSRMIPASELVVLPGETHLSLPLAPAARDAVVGWIGRHSEPAASGGAAVLEAGP